MEEKQNSYFYENRFALLKQSNSSMENILRVSIKAAPGDAPPPERLRTVRPSCENFGRSSLMTMSGFHNRQKKHSARYRKEEECSSYLKIITTFCFSYIFLAGGLCKVYRKSFFMVRHGFLQVLVSDMESGWQPVIQKHIAYKRIYPQYIPGCFFRNISLITNKFRK